MAAERKESRYFTLLLVTIISFVYGCGTTKSQRSTEQLLVSGAVDEAIASMDFRVLSGKTVYLDVTYIKGLKSTVLLNENYIVSSLRQQMLAANCLLQETKETADIIVEPRIGALGTDQHDVTYGVPSSGTLSAAASLVQSAPPVPFIPEISIAKRSTQHGSAKIAVFAYRKVTREPVWQSGIRTARSSSNDVWVFGAGPFQSGTIRKRAQFAGGSLTIPLLPTWADKRQQPKVEYGREIQFITPDPVIPIPGVSPASHTAPNMPRPFSREGTPLVPNTLEPTDANRMR